MKKHLIYPILLLISIYSYSQSFEWGIQDGGVGDDVVRNMVVDEEGNSYTTGSFWYTADFGEGENQISLTSNGFSDIFISKVNSAGDLVWVKNFGGMDNDYANGISLDAEGNIYLTGAFQQTVDFDPEGEGSILTSNGFQDIFVLKLDGDGNFTWVKGFGSANYEESIFVTTDTSGDIYLAGSFFTSIDFDPSDDEFMLNPTSDSGNGFVMKMSAEGEFEWAKQIGGTNNAYSKFVKVLGNGEIYVLGEFTGSCDFNPAVGQEFLVESEGKDIYVLHLDASGNFLNVHTSSASDESGNSEVLRMDIDSLGNMYVIGNFVGTVDFAPLQTGNDAFTLSTDSFYYNSFVLKMNNEGEAAWVKQISGNNMVLIYDIAISAQNEIFLTGFFNENIQLGDINITQENMNYMEAFIAKINTNGEFQFAYQFGGTGGADASEIEVGPDNSIYLSSSFHETIDLNPFEDEFMVTIFGEDGYKDIYSIKLNLGNLSTVETELGKEMVIYPNPTTGIIYLKSKQSLFDKKYEIYNLTGQKLKNGTVETNGKIDLNNLKSGVYMLNIERGYSFKIIKK